MGSNTGPLIPAQQLDTLLQSHLPTETDAYVTTHQWCQWQKQEHSQPLQHVLSSTQSTHPYHIKDRLLFSCSRPVGNIQWKPTAELKYSCCFYSPHTGRPAQNDASFWSTVVPDHSQAVVIPMRQQRDPRPYMYKKKRCWGQLRHNSTVSRQSWLSSSNPINFNQSR